MSHVVSIQSRITDSSAVNAACQRLGLTSPVQGTAKLYSGEATGLLLHLPDWKFPVAINTTTGEIQFDDYEGQWGDRQSLDRFLQMYAVEKAKLEARKRGFTVTEQALEDGSIKIQLVEGGA